MRLHRRVVRKATVSLLLFLAFFAVSLSAQQLNGPHARVLVNGLEPSAYDQAGHLVPVYTGTDLQLSIQTGDAPNASVSLYMGTYAPGAFIIPGIGSVDLANPQPVASGVSLTPAGAEVASHDGRTVLSQPAAWSLSVPLNAGLAGTSSLALQALVVSSEGVFLTEAFCLDFISPLSATLASFPQLAQEAPTKHAPDGSACPCGKSGESDEFVDLDPVYPFSGEYWVKKVDLVVPGRGVDFTWSRKYRSRFATSSALGNGWDHSYNIFLTATGNQRRVYDGQNRVNTYLYDAQRGSWSANGLFQELLQNDDGSYTLVFPDTSEWRFAALDGSGLAGKLTTITDRNGNAMSLFYDAANGHRLQAIIDTLGRPFSIGYDQNGRLTSVSDFAGRTVTYAYYDGSSTQGNDGDLKSATSPVVVGTFHGNDFPTGRAESYTYSTGFAQAALNGNLLTTTDAKGQTFLINEYETTTNPGQLKFDRVRRQTWGDTGDIIDFVYENLTPASINNYAVLKVVLNDRLGHVKEMYYDGANRGVMNREYTGLANPDLPTTSATNRPGPSLRSSDPLFFETRLTWSNQSTLLWRTLPNGAQEQMIYDTANPDPRARGNLLESRLFAGPQGGDQSVIVETFEYDTGIGCCGTNFVTKYTDPRLNITTHSYDPKGNRLQTVHPEPSIIEDFTYNTHGQMLSHLHPANAQGSRRLDTFEYKTSGPGAGFISAMTDDANGLALRTEFDHDDLGRLLATRKPNGAQTDYEYNALDEKIKVTSPAVTGGGVRYVDRIFYDANGNVVKTEYDNRTSSGVVAGNPIITNTYAFDILDTLLEETYEVDSGKVITVRRVYDANRNPKRIEKGAAVSGAQTGNVIEFVYDERDLLFQRIEAPGTPAQMTTQLDYNESRALTRLVTGVEAGGREHLTAYDGYDRSTLDLDPMGNLTTRSYDANGNLTGMVLQGQVVDVPGTAGNVRLRELAQQFDAMNRPTLSREAHFVRLGGAALTDGWVDRTLVWADDSQLSQLIDDNGNARTYTYDSANRPVGITDAEGNVLSRAFDDNSNLLSETLTEPQQTSTGNRVTTWTFAYDGLDRRTEQTDPQGNLMTFDHDSRGNIDRWVDARGTETILEWDGLDRLFRRTKDMNGNGADPTQGADIVTTYAWDDSGRLASMADDKGHATSFTYDAGDRRLTEVRADGTNAAYVWDANNELVGITDANGSVITNVFDGRGRLTQRSVVPGPTVSNQTTSELYFYDGADAPVGVGDDDSTVLMVTDSLSRVIRDEQNGLAVESDWDGIRRTGVTYPGGRSVDFTHDGINRITGVIADGQTAANYLWDGIGRVGRVDFGNGTTFEKFWNGTNNVAGDSGVNQVAATIHSAPDGSVFFHDEHRWDANGNKLRTDRVVRPWTSNQQFRVYGYDRADRMTSRSIGQGLAMQLPTTWQLDGVGNRKTVTTNGFNVASYFQDASSPPSDAQMNQYTTTPFGAETHDANGNRVSWNGGTAVYDYRNQMVSFTDNDGNTTEYRYDAYGRRIEVGSVTTDGAATATRYYYDGYHVVEERNVANQVSRTWVYGTRVDDVVSMQTAGQNYTFHQDDLGSIVAVTDQLGDLVEAYRYSDYGQRTIVDPSGSVRGNSVIGNPIGYTGRRHDAESGLIWYRTRYYAPNTGRFTTRDTIGVWGDLRALGNGYTYVGNNPHSYVDPFGLWPQWLHDGLDLVGLVPGVGEIADLANAGLYASEGNWGDAALSAAGAVPFAGWAATGTKAGKRAAGALAEGAEAAGKSTGKAAKEAGEEAAESAGKAGKKTGEGAEAGSSSGKGDKGKKKESKDGKKGTGKCTKSQFATLKAAVDAACETDKNGNMGVKGCSKKQGFSQPISDAMKKEACKRAGKMRACGKAQGKLSRTCFPNDSKGHRQKAEDALKGAARCQKICDSLTEKTTTPATTVSEAVPMMK